MIGTYRYQLRSTRGSSEKYGPCEVCGKHASEVFSQTKERAFQLDHRDSPAVLAMCPDMIGWAHKGDLFGHEECLTNSRR